jgi:tetratricopeptide (TPR) repeat protein
MMIGASSWQPLGCGELRGRKKIQEGNAAYKRGDFVAAVARFDEAAGDLPELPLLWLNRGYACRELILPGAGGAANRQAAQCALESFKRLRALAPGDPRGDTLYVQTLFDVGEYRTIERTFSLRHERNPGDLDVILGLEQVYARMGRWRDALAFYRKAALLRPADAESQYAVGTFAWQVLQAHGGGPAAIAYDPRPGRQAASATGGSRKPSPRRDDSVDLPQAAVAAPAAPPPPPAPAPGDIVGDERVALAEVGIDYLQRALALRPHDAAAATYIGLLYRQQSLAYLDRSQASAWQAAVAHAQEYTARAAEP